MEIEKLDNPVWHSLSETHKDFSINYDGVQFYRPDYCSFGGFVEVSKTRIALDQYSLLADSFYVVGNRPDFSEKVSVNNELVCNQMLLQMPIQLEIHENIIKLQSDSHIADLFALVNLVQPGYFKTRTWQLGDYYGIYKDEKLIVVTGERMKMNNFTELSSVVTHPEHTGKGYAKQLLCYVSNKVFNEKKMPYLHVADTNIGAIKLYEKLGFATRRKISFWQFVKHSG